MAVPAKLTLLGIDGMDYEIVKSLFEQLPNLSRISKEGFLRRLDSVFPPDSDTAWATIFTGLNPAEHGVVKFVDPLEKSISYLTEEVPSSVIRDRCVWDKLSDQGAKVCVVLPHAAFPPWPVNGVMLSRSSLTNEVRVLPEGTLSKAELDGLKAPRGFPGRSGRSLRRYLRASQALFENTRKTALKLYDEEDWDFFLMYSPILDIVPHFFWKFYDQDDPAYPGPNAFEEVIPRLYSEHDAMIGRFLIRLRKDDLLIVMSDHGHGRRPIYEYKMNEILRREGLLFVNETCSTKDREPRGIELTAKATELLQWLSLENLASSLMRNFPQLRSLLVKPSWIDWDRTVAATIDLSGVKSYSYGGIRINKSVCTDSAHYEDVRAKVTDLLDKAVDADKGVKLALWVKRREQLYQGLFISKYPDLIYQLHPDYGLSPDIGGELIKGSRIRSLVPGTHLAQNTILAGIGPEESLGSLEKIDILGLHKWILSWIGREILEPQHLGLVHDRRRNEHHD